MTTHTFLISVYLQLRQITRNDKRKTRRRKITCFFAFIPPKNAKKIKIFCKCVVVVYFRATFGAKRGIGERELKRAEKETG